MTLHCLAKYPLYGLERCLHFGGFLMDGSQSVNVTVPISISGVGGFHCITTGQAIAYFETYTLLKM